jgi:hypothetical protein
LEQSEASKLGAKMLIYARTGPLALVGWGGSDQDAADGFPSGRNLF